jgi:hypothetical protein
MLFRSFASITKIAVNPTARRHLNPRDIRIRKFLHREDSLSRRTG